MPIPIKVSTRPYVALSRPQSLIDHNATVHEEEPDGQNFMHAPKVILESPAHGDLLHRLGLGDRLALLLGLDLLNTGKVHVQGTVTSDNPG